MKDDVWLWDSDDGAACPPTGHGPKHQVLTRPFDDRGHQHPLAIRYPRSRADRHRYVIWMSCRGGFISPFTIDSSSELAVSISEQAPHAGDARESGRDADRRAAMAVLAQARVDEIEAGLCAVVERL